VGHPGDKAEVVNWVLQKPSQEHRAAIEDALPRSLKALPMLIDGEMEKATMLIHTHAPVRAKPPRKPDIAPVAEPGQAGPAGKP
jgi:PTH1 family peptidyl-tRNA hydrolase